MPLPMVHRGGHARLPIGPKSPIEARRDTQACGSYETSGASARKALFLREIFMITTQKHMHFGMLAIGALLISALRIDSGYPQ